jgi:hypothetical protein
MRLGQPRLGLLRVHEVEEKLRGLYQVYLPEGEKAPKLREDWCQRLVALRQEANFEVHVALNPAGVGVAISNGERMPLEANLWTPNSAADLEKEIQMYQAAGRIVEALTR